MTMKKKLLTTLSVVLILGLAALGILAYLTDTTPVATNVMTLGNVDIEQSEEFEQNTPLYPGTEVDKVVKVTNNGSSDCYTRTLVAFQVIGDHAPYSYEYDLAGGYSVIDNDVFITVEGVNYEVIEFLHNDELGKGDVVTSLTKVGMSANATNEDMTDNYKVFVLSQAVQTAGFNSAEEALDAGFGNVTATMASIWFGDKANTIEVTPENAQQVLDEIGSNMTIKLTAGEYGKLYFRQSEESEVVKDRDYSQSAYDEVKLRTYNNLTIVGEEGVKVDGFETEAYSYFNKAHSNSEKYPVLDSFIVLENVKIDNIAFTGDADAISILGKVSVDGLTVTNCTMHHATNANNKTFLVAQANVDAVTGNVNGKAFNIQFANVTVDNCEASTIDRFILAFNSKNLTVTNNKVSSTDQHFINLQAGQTDHTGVITITDNIYTNGADRFFRAAYLADAKLILERNTVNNAFYGNDNSDDLDLVKVNVRAGSTFTHTNNDNAINTTANTGATFVPTVEKNEV